MAHPRELQAVISNLHMLLGIQVEFGFKNVVGQLESLVTESTFLETDLIEKFKKSKNDALGYQIKTEDNDFIRNIKSLINVLIALNNIDKNIFTKLTEYAAVDPDSRVEGMKKFGAIVSAVIYDRENLQKFHKDLKAFAFMFKNWVN